jgi:two-component system, NarL family, sensor histidine kinase DesK
MSSGAALLETSGAIAAVRVAPEVPRGTSIALPRTVRRTTVMSEVKDHDVSTRFLRYAPIAVAALGAVIPLAELALLAQVEERGLVVWAIVATACYLPLYVRNVFEVTRGSTPSGGVWVLAAMAVLIFGALPLVGAVWLLHFWVLAVSALLVLRPPWSVLAAVAVVASLAPLALALDTGAGRASWIVFSSLWRVAFVFALVWLVGALQRLQEARRALAERAVAAERGRIDSEVTHTLGAALESTLAQGRRAMDRLARDPAFADRELHALVDGARRTLTEARQMISGYQHTSMRAELDTAVSLLTAAGIEARLVLPLCDFPTPSTSPSERRCDRRRRSCSPISAPTGVSSRSPVARVAWRSTSGPTFRTSRSTR